MYFIEQSADELHLKETRHMYYYQLQAQIHMGIIQPHKGLCNEQGECISVIGMAVLPEAGIVQVVLKTEDGYGG